MESRVNLTDLKVRHFKPDPSKRIEIADAGQRGLYLIVQPSGQRGFAVRYRFNGKPRKLTLKAGVSLADARRLAADAMYAVQTGSDPSETKKIEQAKAAG